MSSSAAVTWAGGFLPGGTREPGESLQELTERELLEGAGAQVTGDVELFAAHVADSHLLEPYRPHLPHPRSYWASGSVSAEVVQAPTNPTEGEQVVQVQELTVDEAATYLDVHDRLHAGVVRLAAAMGVV